MLEALNNNSNTIPYIIITAGPAGAGKSKLPKLIIDKLKLNSKFVNIQIDDIVQSNPTYKSKINSIITNKGLNKKVINKITSNTFNNNNLVKRIENAYFAVREGNFCGKKSNMTCNEYNDALLNDAFDNNKNVVFETTGNSNNTIAWLFTQIPKNYKIIIAYMIISYNVLLTRVAKRTLNTFKSYLKKTRNTTSHANKKNNSTKKNNIFAPRLPNTKNKLYKDSITKTYVLLKKNIDDFLAEEPKILGRCNNFFVYDNTINPEVIFEASRTEKKVNANANKVKQLINNYTAESRSH